jgi:chromosome partitioning protein
LQIAGILLTMADTRTTLTRDILQAIRDQFGDEIHIFSAIVKRSVRFGESAVAGQSILQYESDGPGAQAYRQVAEELLQEVHHAP